MRARDRLSLAIGGAALLVSVLVIGGALRWTQGIVAILVALALVMQVGSRRRLVGTSPMVVMFLIAIGLTAAQLIPLPDGVLDALNARGNELRSDGAALAGTAPWHAITLDSAGTLHALGYLVTLLGVAVLGLRLASSERGRYYVLAGVALACGLAAAVTGLHTLLNLDSLYGVYAPLHATPPILGPLLNPNHLGGLMAIGAVLAVGLVFYQRQAPQLRVLWIVLAIGCSATAMASLSRGATLALGLGVATTIALLFASRLGVGDDDAGSRPRRALMNDIPIAIVIAFGLAVAVYTSAGKVADQLDNTSLAELHQPLSKYQAWSSSFQLVEEAPWVGIGRGALEPVFTRVHDASAYITFSHLENEYVQAIVEWGVPGGIAILLALAWCIAIAAKRWRDGPLAAAAIGACAAIMFQNSVDFSVELLGVAVPALLAGTTLLTPGVRETRSVAARGARAALVLGLAGAAALGFLPVTRSIQEDHDWLTDNDDATLDQLREVMARHPLDYLAYGKAAALLLRNGDPQAGKFLNHALALHPTHPGLHRLAARTLIAAGLRSQGAVEYALALHGTLAPKTMITEIVTLLPDVELAGSALPVDAANPEQILRSLHELDHDDIAERWLLHVIMSPQHDLTAIDELYQLAMAHHDLAIAEQAARRRMAESHTHTSRLLLARVMFRREEFDQVLSDLADVMSWTGRIDEQTDAWLLVCDTQIEKRAWDPALECLHKLDGSAVLAPTRRYEVTQRLSIVTEQRTAEAKQKAIEELERALGSRPKSP
ncbi:MAG TPA: O-antigen ligase family protein [Kofleriaceae bacterium]|nr:O-antigen ligase family protein [Kofleriaceae bacterium]